MIPVTSPLFFSYIQHLRERSRTIACFPVIPFVALFFCNQCRVDGWPSVWVCMDASGKIYVTDIVLDGCDVRTMHNLKQDHPKYWLMACGRLTISLDGQTAYISNVR